MFTLYKFTFHISWRKSNELKSNELKSNELKSNELKSNELSNEFIEMIMIYI